MSLDLILFGEDGKPEASVPISQALWSQFMSSVAQSNTPCLLSRMHDYYSDAEFAADDVSQLLAELERVRRPLGASEPRLPDVIDLCGQASKEHAGLCAVAD